ncbi:hypothetical protein Mapa_013954 [Marchantia paleacea]|nr:hypothetical protein Mapa_013954 [Marchantia paleacea]
MMGWCNIAMTTLLLTLIAVIDSVLSMEQLESMPGLEVMPKPLMKSSAHFHHIFKRGNGTAGRRRAMVTGISHMLHVNSTLLPKDCDNRCLGRVQSRRLREFLRSSAAVKRRSIFSGITTTDHVWLNKQKIINWFVTIPVTETADDDVQYVRVVPDTGSFFTWFQCKPCNNCYPQRWPIFDTTSEKNRQTFFYISDENHDPFCRNLRNSIYGLDTVNGYCRYRAYYLDGTISIGSVAGDSFRFHELGGDNYLIYQRMIFGCGFHNRWATNTGIGGVLGLGMNMGLSLPEQAAHYVGTSFAFCLPIAGSAEGSGWFVMGDDGIPGQEGYQGINFPAGGRGWLIYLDAVDMMVGGVPVHLPQGVFDINPNTQDGGLVIDSGFTMSTLTPEAYHIFRDAYREAVRPTLGEVKFGGKLGLDSCWDVTNIEIDELELPNIGYILRNGLTLQIGRIASYFTYYTSSGRPVLCLPFSEFGIYSIFGGYSMQQMSLGFDRPNNRMVWKNDVCSMS